MTDRVSIVIPTFQEADRLRRTLDTIERDAAVEVIVADGGSKDGTAALARRQADRVVEAPRGRAWQLNAGAAAASGEILLFLHADTCLAPGALTAIRRALADPRTAGGAFAVEIDSPSRSLWLIARAVNLRSRLLRLPYGDQGLFVRRATFAALGGFRPLEIMEDVDFVRRLRRRGRLAVLRPPVRTSDRRWRANGVARTTLVNLVAAAMGALAFEPQRIRRFYDAWLVSGREVDLGGEG